MYLSFFSPYLVLIKFRFSKKATKIDEIFTVDLTLCSKCQIDGEDFFGLLRKHELYYKKTVFSEEVMLNPSLKDYLNTYLGSI